MFHKPTYNWGGHNLAAATELPNLGLVLAVLAELVVPALGLALAAIVGSVPALGCGAKFARRKQGPRPKG